MKLFYTESKDSLFYIPPVTLETALESTNTVHLPVEVDTEFQQYDTDYTNPATFNQHNITGQCRSITSKETTIFAHPDIVDIARHPVWKSQFIIIDYLKHLGFTATIQRFTVKVECDHTLVIHLYAFFAVADLYRLFQGDCLTDISNFSLNNRSKQKCNSIDQGRRAIFQNTLSKGSIAQQFIEPNWLVTINGISFKVRLVLVDTCAVQGNTNYSTLCRNTGVNLEYKDVFSSLEKSRMIEMYLTRPDDFDNYAKGDCYNYPALVGHAENMERIYEVLGLKTYYEPPRLTIGATVARLFRSAIINQFGSHDTSIIAKYCEPATSRHLINYRNTTAAYLSKVDGGRCRNNRPTNVSFKGVLADLDISGCYGEGLRVQEYPVGTPVIIDYPIRSEHNKFMTLEKFRKEFGHELVPGLWFARVSTREGYRLKYPQDLIQSWRPPRDLSKIPTDSDLEASDWWSEDNIGILKIFSREIHLGVISHEFLQWLDNVATPRQRKELMEKLLVVSAIYYPASERCCSLNELQNKRDKHKGANTCEIENKKGLLTKTIKEQECHAWYSFNLGELLVDKLLIERKNHPKKSPLNELYKLIINTIYGDEVSSYFDIGNVVVGQNITARARMMAWCMEKGLHGFQSITDGCAFDLNRVVYPIDKGRITSENIYALYSQSNAYNIRFKTLSSTSKIEIHKVISLATTDKEGTKYTDLYPVIKSVDNELEFIPYIQTNKDGSTRVVQPALEWINEVSVKHLQNLFPNLDILHAKTKRIDGSERIGQFEFEAKGVFDKASFHGSANYIFGLGENWEKPKMRSYRKDFHKALGYNSNGLEVIEVDYEPAKKFLTALCEAPRRVKRGKAFIHTAILKIRAYRRHYEGRWENSSVHPGCTIETIRILRECSLAAFTFDDWEQWRAWEREAKRLMDETGQTYESFFLNDDGTVDIQKMVDELDEAIRSGAKGLKRVKDPNRNRSRNRDLEKEQHPAIATLEAGRTALGIRYGFAIPELGSGDEGE